MIDEGSAHLVAGRIPYNFEVGSSSFALIFETRISVQSTLLAEEQARAKAVCSLFEAGEGKLH